MVFVDTGLLSADSLTCVFAILAVGLLLFISSLVSICILLNSENETEVLSYYLISIAFADFICAVFIVPLSMYSSVYPNWNFMGDNSLLCRSAAYVHVVLISSTVYTFAWIGVDRYSAFMKPSRYEIEHTLTRCKCWIAFSWATAILLACPIIVAKMEVNYYHDLEMCVLNWSTTMAYSITLAVLVLLPTLCTVAFTCISVIIALQKKDELEDSQKTAFEMDDNYSVTFFILIALILVWTPLIVIIFLPTYLISTADSSKMKFIFVWLAVGGSSVKLLIYVTVNRNYRNSLCSFCVCLLGQRRKREQHFMTDSNNERMISGLFEAAALGAQTAAKMGDNYDESTPIAHNGNSGSAFGNHIEMNCRGTESGLMANSNAIHGLPFRKPQQLQSYPYGQRQLTPHNNEYLSKNNHISSTVNSPIMSNLSGSMPEYGSFSRSVIPISYY